MKGQGRKIDGGRRGGEKQRDVECEEEEEEAGVRPGQVASLLRITLFFFN